MIPASKWKWFGGVGHFICGRWCRFHLCTQVGPWLISTVGEYVHPQHSNGSETTEALWLQANWPGEDIGCDRKYETMVFRAGKPCKAKKCGCGMPVLAPAQELDGLGYMTAGEATKGHMELCMKWSKKVTP
jgi:hypothetical protein